MDLWNSLILVLILAMWSAIKILDPIRFILDAPIDVIFKKVYFHITIPKTFFNQALLLIALLSACLLSLLLLILTKMALWRS